MTKGKLQMSVSDSAHIEWPKQTYILIIKEGIAIKTLANLRIPASKASESMIYILPVWDERDVL